MFDLHYAFCCLIRKLPDKKVSFFYFLGSVLEGQMRSIYVSFVRKIHVQERNAGEHV